jgi:hypothetical protein
MAWLITYTNGTNPEIALHTFRMPADATDVSVWNLLLQEFEYSFERGVISEIAYSEQAE